MIAISTIQKILHYKLKYSRVGQSTPENTLNDDAWKAFQNTFGTDGTKMIDNITTSLRRLNDETAASNVGLSRFTVIQEEINAAVVDTVAEMTMMEEIESDLTSTFKTGTKELAIRSRAYSTLQGEIKATNDEMASYRAIMEKTSELSGKLFATTFDTGDGTTGLNTYIERQIVANQYLARNTDLTDENAASLAEYAAGQGRSLDEQVRATEALAGAYDGVIDKSTAFEIISKGIAELSSDVRQQYGRIPGGLETAVLKSKMLGVSMAQLSKTGEGLLDIESSVGKEIEYQLLSGQRLVDQQGKSITNQYRAATLNGDAVKQADLLKQVYLTQGKTLSGNNMLAKKALAESLDMSVQDLMTMYEKQKVQEQIAEAYKKQGKTEKEADIAKLLEDPEKMKKFKLELEQSKSEDDKALLKSIKKLETDSETRMSPAEKMEKNLQSIVDQGLKIKNVGDIQTARDAGTKYSEEMKKNTTLLNSPALQQTAGRKQYRNDFVNTANKQTAVMNQIPMGVGNAVSEYSKNAATGYNEFFRGTEVAKKRTKKTKLGGKVSKIDDGIIQFNDKDKVTVVASPFGTMNEKVADKITNPGNASGGSSMDMKSIVSAIQSALGNINITVALDPMAIDKEIKFRQGSLNGKA